MFKVYDIYNANLDFGIKVNKNHYFGLNRIRKE